MTSDMPGMGNLYFYCTLEAFNQYKTYTHVLIVLNIRHYEVNIFILFENISYIMLIFHISFEWSSIVLKPVDKPRPYFGVKNVTQLPFISRGL